MKKHTPVGRVLLAAAKQVKARREKMTEGEKIAERTCAKCAVCELCPIGKKTLSRRIDSALKRAMNAAAWEVYDISEKYGGIYAKIQVEKNYGPRPARRAR